MKTSLSSLSNPSAILAFALTLAMALTASCSPGDGKKLSGTHSYYTFPADPRDPARDIPCGKLKPFGERIAESLQQIKQELPGPMERGRRCALMQDGKHQLQRNFHGEGQACKQLEPVIVEYIRECNGTNYGSYTADAYCEMKGWDDCEQQAAKRKTLWEKWKIMGTQTDGNTI